MDKITILGLVAAFCTTVSFVPQALRTIKTKQTKDISLAMYSILFVGLILWLIYGLLLKDYPLIFANTISVSLAGIILGLKLKYK